MTILEDNNTVYPRVYGGTGDHGHFERAGLGLSPRVRGNRLVVSFLNAWERSIPACTGEPLIHGADSFSDEVYPRVYGGTLVLLLGLRLWQGLSPRVRGNRVRIG